jgi:peptidyl-prolyl cis-trans isomerase C
VAVWRSIGMPGFVWLTLASCTPKFGSVDRNAPAVVLRPKNTKTHASQTISRGEVRQRWARLRMERSVGSTVDPLPAELQDRVLESMIDEALLIAEADRLQVKVSTTSVERELQAMQQAWPPGDFQAQLDSTYQTLDDLREAVRSELRNAQVIEMRLGRLPPLAEAELKASFDRLTPEERQQPMRASAYQVVTTSQVAAQDVRKKALEGTPFTELAKKFGITPEARSGGWLGWIASGRVPTVFEACFLLKPGEISQVIPSEYGFHVFRVDQREPARERTFDDLRPELIQRLQTSRAEVLTSDYLKELRAEYEIEVDETAKTLLK